MVDWLHLHEHIHAYYCLHKQNILLKYENLCVFGVLHLDVYCTLFHKNVTTHFCIHFIYWIFTDLHFMLVFYSALHCAIASLHTRRHDRSAFILEVNWPNFQCSCFTLESWCSLSGEGQERGRSHINSHNSFFSLDKKALLYRKWNKKQYGCCTVVTAAI